MIKLNNCRCRTNQKGKDWSKKMNSYNRNKLDY